MTIQVNRSVQLTILAQPRMLRFARVTAATLAADLAFSIQEIEDLRVAVDELAAAAIEGCDESAMLHLSFDVVGGSGLVVEGRVPGVGAAPDLHPVAQDLLELLADGYELSALDGTRTFRLTKNRSGEG